MFGNFIGKGHVEPLHLKHNVWQYSFKVVLGEAPRKSKVPADRKAFSEFPIDTCNSDHSIAS